MGDEHPRTLQWSMPPKVLLLNSLDITTEVLIKLARYILIYLLTY